MLKILIYSLLLVLLVTPASESVAAQPPVCDPEAMLTVVADDGYNDLWNRYYPTMSGNGRYVAYASENDMIVPDDTNGEMDVFVYDRLDCSTRRVSVTDEGVESIGASFPGKFSDDGSILMLYSSSTNFDPDFTDATRNTGVFLLDLQTQSYNYVGFMGLSADMSGDGRFVVFDTTEKIDPTDPNDLDDLYLYDRVMDTYQRLSPDFNGDSFASYHQYLPGISADGAYIAFTTSAPTLFPADINQAFDAFLYERATGNVQLISTSNQGEMANDNSLYSSSLDWPSLSADGRYVVFQSRASNLVPGDTYETNDVFLYDRVADEITCISVNPLGECGVASEVLDFKSSISADGRYIYYQKAYYIGRIETSAVLIYDRITGETRQISITPEGLPLALNGHNEIKNQYLSDDGQFAIFTAEDRLYLTNWQQLPYVPVTVMKVDTVPLNHLYGLQVSPTVTVSTSSLRLTLTEILQDPAGDNEIYDVTNPANYLLIRADDPAEITHETCDVGVSGGVVVPAPSVSYIPAQKQISVNYGSALVNGAYRLVVCNLVDVHDSLLDGNSDYVGGDPFILNFVVNVPETLSPPYPYYPGPTDDSIGPRQPEFRWSEGGGAASYEIQIDQVDPPASEPIPVVGNTFIPEEDLPLGVNYWRVRSVGANGDRSAWSEVAWYDAIEDGVNAAPIRYFFEYVPPILRWSGVDWATGYQIQIDDDASFSSPDFTVEVESDVLEITLASDEINASEYPYYWRVRAQRENGSWGEWSAVDEFAFRR